MGPHRSENVKTLLLLQIAAESFQNFLPNCSPKTTLGIFEILIFPFFSFDTCLQKISNVIPTAAVKQSAKVHGPRVQEM